MFYYGLLLVDPISPLLDKQQTGLTVVSVSLFLGALALQFIIKESLKKINETAKETKATADLIKIVVDNIYTLADRHCKENHEQWGTVNETRRMLSEQNIRVNDMSETIDKVSEQQTILATAQLNQTKNTEKMQDGLMNVIEKLSAALSEHARD